MATKLNNQLTPQRFTLRFTVGGMSHEVQSNDLVALHYIGQHFTTTHVAWAIWESGKVIYQNIPFP